MSQKEPSVLPTTTPREDKLADDNNSLQQKDADGKMKLRTWEDYRQEWRTGSRGRAIKYYALRILICLFVGGVVGMIIGLAIRYTIGPGSK